MRSTLLLGICCSAFSLSAQNYTVDKTEADKAAAIKAGDVTVVDKADRNEKIFRTPDVDSKPQLKNNLALSAFISYNFKFPDLKNKKVKIFASFVVEPDGSMSDVRTFFISVKDLVANEQVKIATEEEKAYEAKQTDALKAEAVRVLSAFDEKWIPAIEEGKPVRCLYNYPINFNIE
jgi:hypothetical protein